MSLTEQELDELRAASARLTAQYEVTRAARLLGTEVILTGIRSGVTRTLVRLGTDLAGLNTRKTLQEGIDLTLEYLKAEARP